MVRLSALLLALLLGGASAVALSSCGGSDAKLLPGTTASEIEANLEQVRQLAAEEDCIGAEDAVANVAAEVEELREVDLKLKAALEEGTAKLGEVVSRCEEETGEETEPAAEPDVEAEELEEEKKPKKEKPEKETEEPTETEEETESEEGTELPPQANGKGEEKGKGGGPAAPEAEEAPPSGGVGPGVGVEK